MISKLWEEAFLQSDRMYRAQLTHLEVFVLLLCTLMSSSHSLQSGSVKASLLL